MTSHTSQSASDIVLVRRKRAFECPGLATDTLAALQAEFRKGRWYQDQLARPELRAVLHDHVRRAGRGLALIGPGLKIDPPLVFAEQFEPILLGRNEPQLRVLSGEAPTRHERQMRVFGWLFGTLMAVVMAGLAIAVLVGRGRIYGYVLAGMLAVFGLVQLLALIMNRFGSRWYLVPAGVATVSMLKRGGRRSIEMFTRLDTYLLVRLVSNGKTTMLMAELYRRDGKVRKKPITDREAISILAAWQSPLDPPTPARLGELAA